jgi:hypothetical protein
MRGLSVWITRAALSAMARAVSLSLQPRFTEEIRDSVVLVRFAPYSRTSREVDSLSLLWPFAFFIQYARRQTGCAQIGRFGTGIPRREIHQSHPHNEVSGVDPARPPAGYEVHLTAGVGVEKYNKLSSSLTMAPS